MLNTNLFDKKGNLILKKFYEGDLIETHGNMFIFREKWHIYFVNAKTEDVFFKDKYYILWYESDPRKWKNDSYGHSYELNYKESYDSIYYHVYDNLTLTSGIIRFDSNEAVLLFNKDTFKNLEEIFPDTGIYEAKTDKEKNVCSLIFLIENKEKMISNVEHYEIYQEYGAYDSDEDNDSEEKDYYAHPYLLVKIKNKGWNFLDENGEFVWKGNVWFESALFQPDYQRTPIEGTVGVVKYEGYEMVLGIDGNLYELKDIKN